MDQFTKNDLNELVSHAGGELISLYLPTYRAGREVRQNATRFKNLIKQAQARLAAADLGDGPLAKQLTQVAELEGDDKWWQHQSDGLAMFIGNDETKKYRLPLSFQEMVTVVPRAYVRPVMRLLQADGQFYILAVSQNDVRLFSGSQLSVDELSPSELPTDLRSALNIDEYVSSLQQHSTGKPSVSGSMTFHGHGGSDLDVQKKDEIRQYFHRINSALDSYFGTERTPLVFAGVDYLFPIFRETCHYNGLLDEAVQGNPDDLSGGELHAQAWKILELRFAKSRQNAITQVQNAPREHAASDLHELFTAARQGAIDTLLLDETQQIWTVIDEEGGSFSEVQDGAANAEELLNYLATQTITAGGAVYSCPAGSLRDGRQAAAALRFPVAKQ